MNTTTDDLIDTFITKRSVSHALSHIEANKLLISDGSDSEGERNDVVFGGPGFDFNVSRSQQAKN
jgi:hypothetical protein